MELYDLTSYNWHQFNELFLEEIHNIILQSFIIAIFESSTKIVFIKACWKFRQDAMDSSQKWELPKEASGKWFSILEWDPLGSHLGSTTKDSRTLVKVPNLSVPNVLLYGESYNISISWGMEIAPFVHNYHFLLLFPSFPCRHPHPTDWGLATWLAKMVQKQMSHLPHLSRGF